MIFLYPILQQKVINNYINPFLFLENDAGLAVTFELAGIEDRRWFHCCFTPPPKTVKRQFYPFPPPMYRFNMRYIIRRFLSFFFFIFLITIEKTSGGAICIDLHNLIIHLISVYVYFILQIIKVMMIIIVLLL